MQIISGRFRAKKLIEYYNSKTRPSSSRTKEGIFNVIENICGVNGKVVLDLFSGSGQFGLECISRGATHVTFNDHDPEAISIIKKNLLTLKEHNSCVEVFNLNYTDCLSKLEKKYDIIFLDPPYQQASLIHITLDFIQSHNLLALDGVIVIENESSTLQFQNFKTKTKTYGKAVVYFLTR